MFGMSPEETLFIFVMGILPISIVLCGHVYSCCKPKDKETEIAN